MFCKSCIKKTSTGVMYVYWEAVSNVKNIDKIGNKCRHCTFVIYVFCNFLHVYMFIFLRKENKRTLGYPKFIKLKKSMDDGIQ